MYYAYKKSPRYYATHTQDIYTGLGFDYRRQIFSHTLSPVILKNKVNKSILSKVEPMIVYLIDTVKQIKLQYLISLDKNDRNLN